MFLYFVVLRTQDPVSYSRYLLYSGLMLVGLCVNYFVSKLSVTDLLQADFFGALRLSLRQTLMVLSVIVLFLFALKDAAMSRVFLFTFVPLFCGTLVVLNSKLPRLLASRMFHKRRRQPTILLGLPTQAPGIEKWLQNKALYGLDVIGIVTDETPATSTPWPVIGSLGNLEHLLERTGASQVISLQLPNSISRAGRLVQMCEQRGVRLIFINDIEQRFNRSVRFFDDSGVHLVSVREEPLECPFNRVVKRILDVAIALPVVLLVLPPLTLLVYLMHRWQSPGPLFFKQRRGGFQFTPFEIIKFRTMHLANPDESAQASLGDPRVFSMGCWLRRLSIDEIPQFINVLRGEMSIVGPRPHMLEHDSRFERDAKLYRVRSFIRPGITGLAQVTGHRGETRHANDVVQRVRSDVYYLEHWSFGLDWAIILRTAWQMLRPLKAAY
jgi:exopolysaccharide biosynthesis polyprenyl glycosylphosphotransferase